MRLHFNSGKEVGMRRLFAVLSVVALVVLLAVVAVCGVVGLVEVPTEAGLTLAEVAPEFAECPLGATALDVTCLHGEEYLHAAASPSVDHNMAITSLGESEHVKLRSTCNHCFHGTRLAVNGKMRHHGVGVHTARA